MATSRLSNFGICSEREDALLAYRGPLVPMLALWSQRHLPTCAEGAIEESGCKSIFRTVGKKSYHWRLCCKLRINRDDIAMPDKAVEIAFHGLAGGRVY